MNNIHELIDASPLAPLDFIDLHFTEPGRLHVLDGKGNVYHEEEASGAHQFRVGGALGTHTALWFGEDGGLRDSASFLVGCETRIEDPGGFGEFLHLLYLCMFPSGSEHVVLKGKMYKYFVLWLRDHTHTLKGMKYFHPDLKTGLELYADTQREDGMIYDRVVRRESFAQGWRDYTFAKGNFAKLVGSKPDGGGVANSVQRIPVENDVEFLFLECLHATWKATGDTAWMARYLDAALRAVKYSTSDPWRWSEKFGLLKRGYTIDTWDFMHSDDSRQTRVGNACDVDITTYGVMYGDNTGMIAGLRGLAEMLRAADREDEAPACVTLADELQERLDKLAWNGSFYRHHVTEDPSFIRDMGDTDEAKQITLSNAYSINRFIGEEKSAAIISTYKRLREEMPPNSPGEFYNCYPPFEKGFTNKWQYMNGGVSSIVAGELARGAFQFGEEAYGADILRRVAALAERDQGHLNVCFNGNPQTTPPSRSFTPIGLAPAANISLAWQADQPSWGVEKNDLSHFPMGESNFSDVPFTVDPKGVAVSGGRDDLQDEVTVPVGGHHASLYFLHTTDSGSGTLAELCIRYEDGVEKILYLENGKQLGSWFMPKSGEIRHAVDHASGMPKGWPPFDLAWQGGSDTFDNLGVYLWGWDNPRKESAIQEIRVRSLHRPGTYLLLGLTGSDHPVWFPQREVSYGIPDCWGAGAVVYALIEGLAGVVDTEMAFEKATLSPRWLAADVNRAEVAVTYPASGGYVAYRYNNETPGLLCLEFTSSGREITLELLLPDQAEVTDTTLDGLPADVELFSRGSSTYARIKSAGWGCHTLQLKTRLK
jgi:hypothetical protein